MHLNLKPLFWLSSQMDMQPPIIICKEWCSVNVIILLEQWVQCLSGKTLQTKAQGHLTTAMLSAGQHSCTGTWKAFSFHRKRHRHRESEWIVLGHTGSSSLWWNWKSGLLKSWESQMGYGGTYIEKVRRTSVIWWYYNAEQQVHNKTPTFWPLRPVSHQVEWGRVWLASPELPVASGTWRRATTSRHSLAEGLCPSKRTRLLVKRTLL